MVSMSSPVAEPASPAVISKYEPVIGLEVHVQLAAASKIFCGCPNSFGAPPNTNVCPVCMGLPGALPVLSREAVEMAMRAGMALNCSIRPLSRFARKNYFYPDLPKGYQISQYDEPIAEHGWVDVFVDGAPKRVGITRAHMEDDAGKSVHDGFSDSERYSYVDLNRCGTPLIEIVTEPDMRSSDEAHAFLTELKQSMQFVEVSACDMEKGQLRCDANISVRLKGVEKFGVKAEVKNLNSFRFLRMALDYEIARQVALIESGGRVEQETRLYDPERGETLGMRSKEQAHDYRYFPEPDLVPLRVSEQWRERVRAAMPELPAQKRVRFVIDYKLAEYDADWLTADRAVSEYFEGTAKIAGDPKAAANWVMGDLAAALKTSGKGISESPVSAENLGHLIKLKEQGDISGKQAKEIFAKMFTTGDAPSGIIEREGFAQVSDQNALDDIVDAIVTGFPDQVRQYTGGKTGALNFLVGKAMQRSKGQADPVKIKQMLEERLKQFPTA